MKDGNSELRSTLAARLRDEIQRLGLNAETLAKSAGVDKSTVYNYLSGTRVPDAVFLVNARANAGIDAQYVLTGAPERMSGPMAPEDRAALERLTSLPPKVRQTVDDVLLLAWLAADSRRQYHEPVAVYQRAQETRPLTLHEPAPTRRLTKPKKDG